MREYLNLFTSRGRGAIKWYWYEQKKDGKGLFDKCCACYECDKIFIIIVLQDTYKRLKNKIYKLIK